MYCTICGKPSSITIPGSTEPIYLCDSCTNITPLLSTQSIQKVSRQLSFETFKYFLFQLQENKRLVSKMVFQSQQINQLQTNTSQSVVTLLQTQLVELRSKGQQLQTQLSDKISIIQSLELKIKELEPQVEESITLNSFQQTILDSIPSTENIENTTEEIATSVATLQQSINKIIDMLETASKPLPPKLRVQVLSDKSLQSHQLSKLPDIPENDYDEGEYDDGKV